jgi:hypothetical protein
MGEPMWQGWVMNLAGIRFRNTHPLPKPVASGRSKDRPFCLVPGRFEGSPAGFIVRLSGLKLA